MSKFKVDDKVICINAGSIYPNIGLTNGKEYTVIRLFSNPKLVWIIQDDESEDYFSETRFKLVGLELLEPFISRKSPRIRKLIL